MIRLLLLLAGLGLGLALFVQLPLGPPPERAAQTPPAVVELEAPAHPLPPAVRRLAQSPPAGPLRPVILDTIAPPLLPAVAQLDPAAVAGLEIGRIKARQANVRQGPGTGFGIAGRLGRGEEVELLAREGGWVQIRLQGDGLEGWVAASLLE